MSFVLVLVTGSHLIEGRDIDNLDLTAPARFHVYKTQ